MSLEVGYANHFKAKLFSFSLNTHLFRFCLHRCEYTLKHSVCVCCLLFSIIYCIFMQHSTQTLPRGALISVAHSWGSNHQSVSFTDQNSFRTILFLRFSTCSCVIPMAESIWWFIQIQNITGKTVQWIRLKCNTITMKINIFASIDSIKFAIHQNYVAS